MVCGVNYIKKGEIKLQFSPNFIEMNALLLLHRGPCKSFLMCPLQWHESRWEIAHLSIKR